MNRTILIAIIILCLAGCDDGLTLRLPPVKGVIYCPYVYPDGGLCPGSTGLYKRLEGTSRTIYRRDEYQQLRFDMAPPPAGEEARCPFGPHLITTLRNGITYTHYRDSE